MAGAHCQKFRRLASFEVKVVVTYSVPKILYKIFLITDTAQTTTTDLRSVVIKFPAVEHIQSIIMATAKQLEAVKKMQEARKGKAAAKVP